MTKEHPFYMLSEGCSTLFKGFERRLKASTCSKRGVLGEHERGRPAGVSRCDADEGLDGVAGAQHEVPGF